MIEHGLSLSATDFLPFAHLQVDQLHGAATLSSPSVQTRRLSTGLSPVHRPIEQFSSLGNGHALASSPPSQPLGPPLEAASILGSRSGVSNAGALPHTNNNTPDKTPETGPTKTASELQSYYSSRGESGSPLVPQFSCIQLTTDSCTVILSTYPGQAGIRPLPLKWYAQDPKERGPVVASRHPNSIKIRNSIGAYGGSYSGESSEQSAFRVDSLMIAIASLPRSGRGCRQAQPQSPTRLHQHGTSFRH